MVRLLLEITSVKDPRTFGCDPQGRTTLIDRAGTANDQVFTYDHESRITSVTRGGQAVAYAYNGLDTRTTVTMGSTVNNFLRDGAYVTDPVLVDSGATYTPGVSERRGERTTFLHSGLKNAFAQTDVSQGMTSTREYDAFGNVTSSSGDWAGPFGYAGKFGYQSFSIPGTSTPDDGLKLLGHRHYDPSTGRFLTRDPIKDGRNWYVYCHNDPLAWVDASGLRRRSIWQWLSDQWEAFTDFIGGGGSDIIEQADSLPIKAGGKALGAATAVTDVNEHGFGNYDRFHQMREDKSSPTWISLRPDDARPSPGLGRPDWSDGKENDLFRGALGPLEDWD